MAMELKGVLESEGEIYLVPFMDGAIHMSYIPLDELRAMRKKSMVTSYEKHQAVKELDDEKFSKAIGRRAVKGWDGYTLKGEEFLYSRDNCDLLMSKWLEFATCVADTCSEISRLKECEREDAVGNSSSTSGGE